MTRPTYASMNWTHLRHNYQQAKQLAGTTAYAVVKANAYGHGLVQSAQALSDADGFAVACVDEAQLLREAGIQRPILVLQGPYSSEEWIVASRLDLQLVIHHRQQLQSHANAHLNTLCKIWIKLNSGMNRVGFLAEEIEPLLTELQSLPTLEVQSIISHFASADAPQAPDFAKQLAVITSHAWPLPLSLSNSAALFHKNQIADYPQEAVCRPGILLYGASPFADKTAAELNLKPVLSLRSKIISIHPVAQGEYVGYGQTWQADQTRQIAVIAIGYGDGYPRHAPNGTPVWVAGQRCPLVGRVSMDMITVDITEHPHATIGSDVELWGEHISVDEIAQRTGTIGYELLCQLTPRVKRISQSS